MVCLAGGPKVGRAAWCASASAFSSIQQHPASCDSKRAATSTSVFTKKQRRQYEQSTKKKKKKVTVCTSKVEQRRILHVRNCTLVYYSNLSPLIRTLGWSIFRDGRRGLTGTSVPPYWPYSTPQPTCASAPSNVCSSALNTYLHRSIYTTLRVAAPCPKCGSIQ